MAPHSSTLAWKIPWMEEPGGLQSMGSRLSIFTFTFHFHALEKEMATHSSVLAWRIPGTVEPGGLPSMGLHRVRHDWSDLAAAVALANNHVQPRLAFCLKYQSKLFVANYLDTPFLVFKNFWFWSLLGNHLVVVQLPSHVWLWHPGSIPGFLDFHFLPELAQIHGHWVGDAIQPPHPLSSPSAPALNLFQHWVLFQWVCSLHQVA